MLQYAQDAAETDKPWLRWQRLRDTCAEWVEMTQHPAWVERYEYRRKPRVIVINGIEVPEPLREKPEVGAEYYTVSLDDETGYSKKRCHNDRLDDLWLKSGLIHITSEAAKLHAKALLSFTKK
jgi:hypothetical protein